MKRLVSVLIACILIAACNDQKHESIILADQAVQADRAPGECPYLTRDNKGNTVLSWIRIINDSTTAFCYATSKDGKVFSSPVVIPNSENIQPHGENLPKIIFKPSGEVIALWGARNMNPKNKYSGLIYYTQSFDEGKHWTDLRLLISDTASYDQRYYDVDLLPDGEVGIIWLDNRKTTPREGSGLYFARTNGKNGFEGSGQLISEPCCQCCRTDLFVDRKGGIHALFRGIIQDSVRDMVHIVSLDGGKTFSTPERISDDNWVINGCPHTGPAMTENQNGIHFSWFTGGRNRGCYYTNSANDGKTFAARNGVSKFGSHPQMTSLSNGELLIVWDESASAGATVAKRIGIQKRSADGNDEGKDYITDVNSFASYPVIAAINNQEAIVAYTKKENEKSYIEWQKVSVN
ncbi:MAG TPA: sialidase family protein [Acidobacteriota bacterium]